MKNNILKNYLEIKEFFKHTNRNRIIFVMIKNSIITVALAYLFYDNLLFLPMLMPCFLILLLYAARDEKKRARDKLLMQFQDLLSIMSQSLQAGNSIENAFIQAEPELRKIHNENSMFMQSLRKVINGLSLNIPIEKLVNTMAIELEEEEILNFAIVFSGAKRSGANLVETVSFTVNTILDKIRVNRETDMVVSSKKMEQNIMSIIPMAILLYVKFCCGDFINCLYHNMAGIIIMSIFVFIYCIAYIWSNVIINIEV